MSRYLLDTNVVSEMRKGKRANPGVLAWLASVEDADLCLSVLVVGEIRRGVEQARSSTPAKARALEVWLGGLEQNYGGRVLPLTTEIAAEWGRLSALCPLSPVDGLVAATALVHDLTLVTRNVNDMVLSGVQLLNPFSNR